jgi:uncharacterized protein YecA (UPF0149 family)
MNTTQKTRQKKVKTALRLKRESERFEKSEQREEFKLLKKERQAEGTNNSRTFVNFHKKHLPERNAPCFCGSGKKFKLCCWNKTKSELRKPIQFAVDKNVLVHKDLEKTISEK